MATDCFSRKCSVQPLKENTGEQVKRWIIRVFEELVKHEKLQCDNGREFYNTTVKSFLKQRNIISVFCGKFKHKMRACGAMIRTPKGRIFRLFRHQISTRFIDRLDDIIYSYNHSKHSAHGMRPMDITQNNSLYVCNEQTRFIFVLKSVCHVISETYEECRSSRKYDYVVDCSQTCSSSSHFLLSPFFVACDREFSKAGILFDWETEAREVQALTGRR